MAQESNAQGTPTHKVRIWDLPTRLFHWLLATAVIALVVTAKLGGNAMNWHLLLGHAVLALLLFRLLWGVVGGRWSRFASFIHSPSSLLRHLRGRGQASDTAGHSPLGALSVFAMLAVLIAQVGSGLLSDDEIAFSGPLSRFVSGDTVAQATAYHAHWGQYLLYVLLALHLLAIAFYTWRGRGLVRPMLTGDKHLAEPLPASRDTAASRLLALAVAAAAGLGAWWVQQLGAAF
ncbi:Cytochrome b [Delftia tsuruhatensis]|uniref:cytochrome b/b6 domain-containing protein n=1 Tax=Delftia tsuruhatensis TaxID=180282 RepID=UPI001E6DC126|nr:cytochrome b/b6 domain-containing protein [Delftia tsuruhatensis]CAB5723090.1 Cytochrome b [Delftia tsuruhatensis]CAC9676248.1 Cytochrome b [Delftia tsuruhatensis]